ncbi:MULTISPECIES: hypothetical protein [unclassified Sporosarcina]|uniref:hypothetical protein n=1 Tax=unclassified Sporosarcina TaxID=2647733 RepID=UPI0013042820|nr:MULTISPECIES: hypothetical protein [unclassified Sporosarcina]
MADEILYAFTPSFWCAPKLVRVLAIEPGIVEKEQDLVLIKEVAADRGEKY